MNKPNPLVPQGVLPEHRGKSHFRVAVFTILAVHVMVLGGLLVQGCKKEVDKPTVASETNAYPGFAEATNLPAIFTDPVRSSNSVAALPPYQGNGSRDLPTDVASSWSNKPSLPGPGTPTGTRDFGPVDVNPPAPDLPPPTSNVEHTVIRGDTFGLLAKKYRVSVKAIEAANPGAVPTRLKIGQRLVIPVTERLATAQHDGTTAMLLTTGNGKVHVVKSGDTLVRIAKANKTTVKAIRDANNLRSDRITVGYKLKIPSGGGAASPPSDDPDGLTQPQPGGTRPPVP